MFRKILVVIFSVIFVFGSVFTIFMTETYGTLKDRDFYTEKVAVKGYDSLIEVFGNALREDVFSDFTDEEVKDFLEEKIEEEDMKEILGVLYDDINEAFIEEGELVLSISLDKFAEDDLFGELPGELLLEFEVGGDVEGNFVEYLSEIFNMTVSVVWAFLLLSLAIIALVVLKPWYKILKVEVRALFIAGLLLSITAFALFFSSGVGNGFGVFFLDLLVRDVTVRILFYSVPVTVLLFVGMVFLDRYIKKLDEEGRIFEKN